MKNIYGDFSREQRLMFVNFFAWCFFIPIRTGQPHWNPLLIVDEITLSLCLLPAVNFKIIDRGLFTIKDLYHYKKKHAHQLQPQINQEPISSC